jgi:uncharacterized membrane protein YeaQ/YmgE (transglycosylase-associated protein family)
MLHAQLPLLIGWSMIGAAAGAVFGMLRTPDKQGLIDNCVDGVLGACVGGLMLQRIELVSPSAPTYMFAAATGAFLFLLLTSLLRRA